MEVQDDSTTYTPLARQQTHTFTTNYTGGQCLPEALTPPKTAIIILQWIIYGTLLFLASLGLFWVITAFLEWLTDDFIFLG